MAWRHPERFATIGSEAGGGQHFLQAGQLRTHLVLGLHFPADGFVEWVFGVLIEPLWLLYVPVALAIIRPVINHLRPTGSNGIVSVSAFANWIFNFLVSRARLGNAKSPAVMTSINVYETRLASTWSFSRSSSPEAWGSKHEFQMNFQKSRFFILFSLFSKFHKTQKIYEIQFFFRFT